MIGQPKVPAKDSAKSSFEPRPASGAFEPRAFESPVEKAAEPASGELFDAYLQRKARLEAAGQAVPGARRGAAGVQHHQISPGAVSVQRAFTKVPEGSKSGEWTQKSAEDGIDCWYNDSYPQWHFTVWLATEDEHVSCTKGGDAGTKVGYINSVMTETPGKKRKGKAAQATCIALGWEILHDARASVMLNYINF
jgi:hypothetical protein